MIDARTVLNRTHEGEAGVWPGERCLGFPADLLIKNGPARLTVGRSMSVPFPEWF
jgi:hypothetical protein